MSNRFNDAVVVGGGTMGSGIAQVFLESGASLVLIEVDQRRADSAAEQVKAGIRSKLIYENNRTDGPQVEAKAAEILARFSTTVGLPAPSAAWSPDLVIESVFEDVEVKSDVLTRIETVYPECPLVATNTSSLSINALSSRLLHPENLIGMHFFNPVPRSSLVELILGTKTSQETINLAQAVVAEISRESILVHDSPGFATSRLGIILGLEAIRMVEEGVASAEDIDQGMVLGYKHPMGPLKLTDLVGLDIRLAISEYLEEKLGPRFSPPQLLRTKVAIGELGKKSGKGFYEW
ncbi:MAG: 3-hydroxyacyl-CoA dehydrogenase family protein [Acidimicrobiaceae bacterium]|nr:3-hydroxyacyl-CoA dehydrogenase family protein [Acidimicrobiaceae bacterium]